MWRGGETFPQCFLLGGLRTQTSAAALVRGPRNDYFVEYTYKNILFIFYSLLMTVRLLTLLRVAVC